MGQERKLALETTTTKNRLVLPEIKQEWILWHFFDGDTSGNRKGRKSDTRFSVGDVIFTFSLYGSGVTQVSIRRNMRKTLVIPVLYCPAAAASIITPAAYSSQLAVCVHDPGIVFFKRYLKEESEHFRCRFYKILLVCWHH